MRESFRERVEIGRGWELEARSNRSPDQPDGPTARATACWYALSPVVGVEIENVADLFADGFCRDCALPLGPRAGAPMAVRFGDPIGRSCDGLTARSSAHPRGPTRQVYSKRFLERLTPSEIAATEWRPVEVVNPGKRTFELFEFLGARFHADCVELRGGYTERFRCTRCGYESPPLYAMPSALPDWVAATWPQSVDGLPARFIAEDALPDPPPALFSIGTRPQHLGLASSDAERWPTRPKPGMKGISLSQLGVIPPELATRA